MKKKLFVFAGILFVAFISCSAQDKKDLHRPKKTSLLWKISGKELTESSYLFGTIHMTCKVNFVWTPVMKKAFTSADRLVMEMDLSNPDLVTKTRKGLMLPPGKSLQDYFSEEDYKLLTQYCTDSLNLPTMVISRLKPFAILSLMIKKINPCKETKSYELTLTKWAKQNDKDIAGLETAEDQLKTIANMNQDSLAAQLIKSIKNPKKSDHKLEKLQKLYKKQNLSALYQQIKNTTSLKGDLNDLLFSRNKNWIPKIEKFIHEEPTFIAVGAGHLGGPKGVIELLRKQGYKVTPVR